MANKNQKHDLQDQKEQHDQHDVQALLKEINDLKEQNQALMTTNQTFQKQIEQLNQDYVSKLTVKTDEIKEILKSKEQALQARFADEVKMGVFKVFKYDMDTLLTQINHFSKIVNNQYDDPKLQGFLVGFQMIANQMQAGLSDLNIHVVNPVVGEILNDETMEVFETIKTDEHPALTILEVISPGYTYDNKTIKFAVVRVAA
ncbi:nucleotide exchange factor GrpE [Ureaplasma zalophigenitalium]|uniref:Nucleotide exchange factor GrpE n=1 Tax=Ureaplasma zalophigenitalium TaxID=907723 RepID=A0ABT3BNV1_9BACT|nr:nucleotide exchange factor GrpE [Ureaplasma zalophigenitalium]MCV3753935.1 nucleotide exchange factor GrpE [Ureaplasma zalophigenitalium]